MAARVKVVVDNRLRLGRAEIGPEVERALVAAFTCRNPQHAKKRAMGFSTWGEQATICTARLTARQLTLPRGGTQRVRDVLGSFGLAPAWEDRRLALEPVDMPEHRVVLRGYQEDAVQKMIARENCLMRAPTGAGKTTAALALIARVRQPALVILWSANLLEQWRTRLQVEFGMRDRDIGMIRGGRRRLGIITLAMQQSLWAKGIPEEVSGNFGLVLLDECFDADARVLMADGTQKRIADVEVGDEIAVGGRVTAKHRRYHDGPRVAIGDSYVTSNHPIATDRGWVVASMVRGNDSIWYDPLHELRDLRTERQGGQQERNLSPAWLEQELRCRDREVSPMRRNRSLGAGEGKTRVHEVRNYWSLEQGAHSNGGPETRLAVQEHAETGGVREDRGSLEESRDSCPLRGGDQSGSAPAVLQGVGEGRESGEVTTIDSRGSDYPIWRENPRQRETPDRLGEEDAASAGETRVHCGACGRDRFDSTPLQDRPGKSSNDGGCGAGRGKSQRDSEAGVGREEGLVPEVSWVVGSPIPGWQSNQVRLQFGCANVHRSVQGAGLVYNLETERGVYVAAGVLVHNCQRASAKTVRTVIDAFPARYRFAISADERRKDQMDFLTYDLFGPVAADVKRADLVDAGTIHDVTIRVSPTSFEADWYGGAAGDSREAFDFNRLLDEMTHNADREARLLGTIQCELAGGHRVLVFTHRVEHARQLSDAVTLATGHPCGLMIGGPENAVSFEETRRAILAGTMSCAVGTVQAIGQGIDLPAVDRGIVATPVASNRQLFDQVRGRICRRAEGKDSAELVYLLDWRVYPGHLKNIEAWCDDVSCDGDDLGDLRERCSRLARSRRSARWGRREDGVPGFED